MKEVLNKLHTELKNKKKEYLSNESALDQFVKHVLKDINSLKDLFLDELKNKSSLENLFETLKVKISKSREKKNDKST